MAFRYDAHAALLRIAQDGPASPGHAHAAPQHPHPKDPKPPKAAATGSGPEGRIGTLGPAPRLNAKLNRGLNLDQTWPDLDALTERAAIIQAEGGLARDAAEAAAAQAQGFAGRDALYAQVVAGWRHGLERLEARAGDPRATMHIAAALQFLDAGWGQRALGLGWSAEEIIGLSPRAPWDRFDRMGIAWARHPTIALTETTATHCAPDGTTQRSWRVRCNADGGARLPWEDAA